jgi:hypothetical protein
MHVAQAKVEDTFWDGAVLAQERGRLYYPPTGIYENDEDRKPAAVRSVIRCETQERLTCREHVVAYGKPRLVPYGELGDTSPAVPQTWDWERTFAASDEGWLRASPCRRTQTPGASDEEAASVVPCFAPDASRLP